MRFRNPRVRVALWRCGCNTNISCSPAAEFFPSISWCSFRTSLSVLSVPVQWVALLLEARVSDQLISCRRLRRVVRVRVWIWRSQLEELGAGLQYGVSPIYVSKCHPWICPSPGPEQTLLQLSADRFFPTQLNQPSYISHIPQSNHPRKHKMLFTAGSSATLCLALVLVAGQRALAANDWSAPCTQGKCSWDLPGDSGASGTVHIVRLCFTCAKHVAFSGPLLT
jgi:hypothetical protein